MKKLGPYTLHDRIACGGMGEIYLATLHREAGFEKLLAVKRILPHLADDPSFVRMFESEARLSALLNHRNIVHVYDFGSAGGEAFLAMEYVDGFDLRSLLNLGIETGRYLGVGHALRIAGDCARALDYAHRRAGPDGSALRIVHRDVSPQNVLVSMEGEVKLTDFGLARTLALDPGSLSGTLKGKLAYMSPEQIRGDEIDARADIFALGAVLYEALSYLRVHPPDLPLAQLVARVTRAEHVPLDEARPDLPEPVRAVVRTCLAADRACRYESAAVLERAIRDVALELGVAEPTCSLADYLRPFADRRRVVASLQEDGTVVSRRPIVRREEPTPVPERFTLADTCVASDGPARTIEAEPARLSRHGPARRVLRAAALALLLAAGLGAVTLWLIDRRRVAVGEPGIAGQAALPPASVRRRPEPAEPRPAHGPTVAAAAEPAGGLALHGVPNGATCFVLDLLRDSETTVRCDEQRRLAPGPYRVVVTAPGRQPFRADVAVKKGAPTLVEVALPERPPAPCSITIATEPEGASLTLDGASVAGRTPISIPSLAPGPHEIALALPGYRTASETIRCEDGTKPELAFELDPIELEVRVGGVRRTLRPGASTSASIQLGAVRATFRVAASSNGALVSLDATPYARVAVNGRPRGATPVRFRIALGRSYEVSLSREGAKVGSVRLGLQLAGP